MCVYVHVYVWSFICCCFFYQRLYTRVLFNTILHMYLSTITHYFVMCDCAYNPRIQSACMAFLWLWIYSSCTNMYIYICCGSVMVTTTRWRIRWSRTFCWYVGWLLVPCTCLSHHICCVCRNHYDRDTTHTHTHSGQHAILNGVFFLRFLFTFLFSRLFQFDDAKSSEVVNFGRSVHFDCLKPKCFSYHRHHQHHNDINTQTIHIPYNEYKSYTLHNSFTSLKFCVYTSIPLIYWLAGTWPIWPQIAVKYVCLCECKCVCIYYDSRFFIVKSVHLPKKIRRIEGAII